METRPYQQRLITKAIDKFKASTNSIMIEAPTGSGKSCVGLSIAKQLQDEFNIGIGWIAMRRQLLNQIHVENEKLNIGVQDLTTISMFQTTIPTVDAAGRPIQLLINDECQHSPTASNTNILNTIKPRWMLGLSATGYRCDRLMLGYSSTLHDAGIHQLISQGYLSPYHQYTIDKWNVDTVVSTFLNDPSRWGKSAIYWHRRENAIECARRLNEAGIKTATIFGDEPWGTREEKLEQFENGDIQVLVNMILLCEGWNCPGLKTVFCRDSSKGPSTQICGRVFRKFPGIPFKQVVQSKNTRWPIHRTATPAQSYVWMDNNWRSYTLSESIDKVVAKSTIASAQTQTEFPKWLSEKTKRHKRRSHTIIR